MDKLGALKIFVAVAEEGGFSRAAAELGLSKSVASRQIAALEHELGSKLLKRSTRRVGLTEPGQAYLDRAKAILSEIADADRAAAAPHDELAGQFRVAAPLSFGLSHLTPAAAAFMARYPKLHADVILTDRTVDAGEESFDLVLRIGASDASRPSVRQLGQVELGLFAAPAYVSRHSRPQSPADLESHAGLVFSDHAARDGWSLRGADGPVPVRKRLSSNNSEVLRQAALEGLGIALLPVFLVAQDAKAGRLVRLLDGFEPKPQALLAEFPPGRVPSRKTRLFVDFLAERYKGADF